ncbi:MAG: VWA domain-containing protein, partial [Acidobacteriaceae bacterium]
MTQGALALVLSFFLFGAAPQQQTQPNAPAPQEQASSAQQSVPNAPTPSGLSNLRDRVKPGAGTAAAPATNPQEAPPQGQQQPPTSTSPQSDHFQQKPPEIHKNFEGASTYIIRVPVNYVDVPVTVRDKHHHLVAGLNWRQFKVYEDGQRQRIAFFTTDPYPLSVAFVIDQSLPADIMRKVNQSLGAVAGAFGPSDSVAVFTYNSSPEMVTSFTGSQGPRLQAALQSAKRTGRSMGVPMVDGPFASGPMINGREVDPNLATQRGGGPFLNLPKEVHPLNDAILEAAKQLSQQPKGRRRIIYVITDGKEAGSKASQKEVLQYLLTNNISGYGTIVGDSALWGV